MRVGLGVAAIVAALCFAGSGAGEQLHAGRSVPLQPAPLIQSVDEAPPDDMAFDWTFDPAASEPSTSDGGQNCTTNTSGQTWTSTCSGASGFVTYEVIPSSGTGSPHPDAPPEPTPAELEQLQQDEEAAFNAIRPAAPPRVIAKLDLGDGTNELLAAWHNSTGDVCVDVEEADVYGGFGGDGPTGPCQLAAMGIFAAQCTSFCAQVLPPCSVELCLSSSDNGDETPSYVLTGTVAAQADELDITDATGATRAFPLTGPLVPGSNLRVFMLDLGANDWRRLDLLAAGRTLESQQMPLFQARSEDCDRQVASPDLGSLLGNDPPDQARLQAAAETWFQAYNACLTAGGVDLWSAAAP